jgi:hypothetical protein
MSKIEVDAIEPQSGTTLTIGASGDTITIPSGATLSSTDPLVFPAGTASAPAVTTTSDTNTGIFFPSADTIAFTEGGTEAMRIDSDGDVGIGTTTPSKKLDILSNTSQDGIRISGSSAPRLTIIDTTTPVQFDVICADTEAVLRTDTNHPLVFSTNGTERMRILSTGNVLVGKTADDNNAGVILRTSGEGYFVMDANSPLAVNRLTNDGQLVAFFQASVQEGSISVSGATVSYNGFTGSHWSRFIDESKPDVLRGTVMESLDQMTDWYAVEFEVSTTEKDKDGNDVVKTHTEHKPYALKANEQEGDVITYSWNTEKKDEDDNDIIEQVQATIVKEKDVKHVMSKISDTVEAKNVYGVFSAWDNDDLINNDFYVASVGSYVVRIKAGQVVAKGDLLQSNGDGTAKVQADDLVRASSFAKVLSNTVIDTYEDGSFIVPCSLMC